LLSLKIDWAACPVDFKTPQANLDELQVSRREQKRRTLKWAMNFQMGDELELWDPLCDFVDPPS